MIYWNLQNLRFIEVFNFGLKKEKLAISISLFLKTSIFTKNVQFPNTRIKQSSLSYCAYIISKHLNNLRSVFTETVIFNTRVYQGTCCKNFLSKVSQRVFNDIWHIFNQPLKTIFDLTIQPVNITLTKNNFCKRTPKKILTFFVNFFY